MDMEKIFKALKKIKSPVIENSLGICVVSVVQRICEKRRYFSTLEDNYYIGIQLDTYKNLNCSYERVKQKLKVIKHNKEIAKINPVYKNEYEREVNALSYYIKKTVKFELSLLEEDILKRGKDIVVKEGEEIKKGTIIGKANSNKIVTNQNVLLFEVYEQGKSIDPEVFYNLKPNEIK